MRMTVGYPFFKTHELSLKDSIQLYAKTEVSPSLTFLEWEAPSLCYVTTITVGGTTPATKLIYVEGILQITLRHLNNYESTYQPSSGRPFLFRLQRGDKIKIVFEQLKGGTHSACIMGYYEDELMQLHEREAEP